MSKMFYECIRLKGLDIGSFNTAKVTDMSDMFYKCNQMTELDLASFNIDKTTSLNNMFYNCTSLKTIYVSSLWKVASKATSPGMFYNCTSIVGGKGTVYSPSHLNGAYANIDGGPSNPGYLTLQCDLNNDSKVSTADIQVIINEMKKPADAQDMKYDLNGDGKISTADIQVIINEMKK